VNLGSSGVNIVGGSITPGTSSSSTTGGVTTTKSTSAILNQNSNIGVNLPSYSSSGGTLALSLFSSSLSRILNLEIAALETDGTGKVISSPRVITANNVKAKIEDGTEIPYVTTSSTGALTTQTVTFKSAKLSLEVTPQITPEGTVKMALLIKKEDADYANLVQGQPPIKSSTVETNVVVENGGTVVVGGVYITNNSSTVEKVPLLGDIPVLGALFRVKTDNAKRRELLIFITPRVLSDQVRVN
jgi:type IV pilus assembly protein PilQ